MAVDTRATVTHTQGQGRQHIAGSTSSRLAASNEANACEWLLTDAIDLITDDGMHLSGIENGPFPTP